MDPDLFAGFDFAAYVDLRGGIVSYEHDSKSGAYSSSGHGFHFRGNFAANFLCDFGSVKDESRHDWVPL